MYWNLKLFWLSENVKNLDKICRSVEVKTLKMAWDRTKIGFLTFASLKPLSTFLCLMLDIILVKVTH